MSTAVVATGVVQGSTFAVNPSSLSPDVENQLEKANNQTTACPSTTPDICSDAGGGADLQPETKTEPQPRSHWPRLIVRARATDTRSRRGAKDSEQKTCSSIIVPEEREESRKRSKVEKREKTFFLSQALTLPHTALVTMVGNKKEEPWLWTKGCPSLSASRLSLVSVPRGRSQQQQERQRAKGG